MEAGTRAPGCPQPGRRSPRRRTCRRLLQTHFPGSALRQSERQQTQRAGCQLAPVWRLIFLCAELRRCSISKESAGGARLPRAPPGQGLQAPVPTPAPAPWVGAAPSTQPRTPGRFRGLLTCMGDGEVFRYQRAAQPSPPHASLQLSLKTEKFVLVFLLLLSSYEMSPVTESLNKPRLLKQHLKKSASLQSPSPFQTFDLLRPE